MTKSLKIIAIIETIIFEIILFIIALAFVGVMVLLTKYSFSWQTVIYIYFIINWIDNLTKEYDYFKLYNL